MKNLPAYIITMTNNSASMHSARMCQKSIKEFHSSLVPLYFEATTPETIRIDIEHEIPKLKPWLLDDQGNVKFNWPTDPSQEHLDLTSGVYKKAYNAVDQNKVIACAISHIRLWNLCAEQDVPMMILEHDARFVRSFWRRWLSQKPEKLADGDLLSHSNQWWNGVVSINDPRGATRRANTFHARMQGVIGCRPTPTVNSSDDPPLAQGLPGNSAYCIKPWAAEELLKGIQTYGLWPNDAYMCKELFPWLQSYYPYFTQVAGTPSTTTL